MNLLTEILILIVSFAGLICGYILALIAPEELRAGKEYLRWGRRIIFVLLFFVFNYFLYLSNYYLIIPFTIIAVVLFSLEFVKTKRIYELFNYLLFAVFYFLVAEKTIIAGLIFLYGLPVGTLLRRILNKE